EVEVRRNHREVRKRPLAALDLDALGRNELEQVADRRGQDVVATLVVVAVTRETPERASDVVRDGRLLGDDELLCHGEEKTARAGRQRWGQRYAKRRIISGIGKRGKEPPFASPASGVARWSVHLPVLPVRNQLIEHQRIDVSAARP